MVGAIEKAESASEIPRGAGGGASSMMEGLRRTLSMAGHGEGAAST
jgi:hypothetical protein